MAWETAIIAAAFSANSFLLEELKKTSYGAHRWLRILTANLIVNSVLCLVNYGLLFSGIYAYEQVVNLVFNGWVYKCIITVFSLPILLWIYDSLNRQALDVGVST